MSLPVSPDPKRVAEAYFHNTVGSRPTKTAGEVRFVKDRGGDKSEWAWATPGPSQREIGQFTFNPKFLKPLAQTLRSTLMALGHATSAHARLVKIKSRNVSPDGALGGRGYIQKISDMRRQLMNVIEVLSASSDTLYDELNAPHWSDEEDHLDSRDRDEVREIIEDAENIKEDPEGWAEEEEAEELEEVKAKKKGKKASLRIVAAAYDLPTILSALESRVASLNLLSVRIEEVDRVACDLNQVCSDLQAVGRSLRVEN